MHEYLNDPVDMTVDFVGHRVRPRVMRWDKRVYTIKKINLIHPTNEKGSRVFYFSTSDDQNFFKLRLDAGTLEWRLVELYTDG